MKRKAKRFMYAFIASLLLVSMNINPVATICTAIADSGIAGDLGTIFSNIAYVASKDNAGVVHAEETETPAATCDCDFSCDATAAINKLMEANADGTGGTTMKDIEDAIGNNATVVGGYIEAQTAAILGDDDVTLSGLNNTLETGFGDVNANLEAIQSQLSSIQGAIQAQQHEYRVAHLYSLNNEEGTSLWRPYSSDVPYVEDFAYVTGQFANVYTGYWDSAVTTIQNPGGLQTSRALEVLGYDAIVRYEGVVAQMPVAPVKTNGGSGESYLYKRLETAEELREAQTIITWERQYIDEEAITWIDAVTLLYKALGQEQYTYQSFMSHNRNITPETSPAFQNLSNPVKTMVYKDGELVDSYYQGFDYKIFLSRSNLLTGTAEDTKQVPIYWTKALNDGFVSPNQDKDATITGTAFLQLAHQMMVAYGEPEITRDETMALLQVYGTNFPISLGIEVADAWAYLKVRGCLSEDVIPNIGSTITRDDLLDICMRIKDEDSRLDYKSIDIVLDIGELLRDDGYYPVYDLEFSVGEFASYIEYNYADMKDYGYCIVMSPDMRVPDLGGLVICSEKDTTKKITDAKVISTTKDVDGNPALLFTVPKTYTGSIYVAKVDMSKNEQVIDTVNQRVQWIEIPSTLLGGGLFFNAFTVSGSGTADATATATAESYHPLDYKAGDKQLLAYADFERAKESRPAPTQAASNATILEELQLAWDTWTTPMVAYAAPVLEENDVNGRVTAFYYTPADDAFVEISKFEKDSKAPGTANIVGSENLFSDSTSKVEVAGTVQALFLARASYILEGSTYNEIITKAAIADYDDSGNIRTIAGSHEEYGGSPVEHPINNYKSSVSKLFNNIFKLDGNIQFTYDTNKSESENLSRLMSALGPDWSGLNNLEVQALLECLESIRANTFMVDYLLGTDINGDASKMPTTVLDKYKASSLLNNSDANEKPIWEDALKADLQSDVGKDIADDITLLGHSGVDAVYRNITDNKFVFRMDDWADPTVVSSSIIDMLGKYESIKDVSGPQGSSLSSELDIKATVATSAIMSREEHKMLSWESLVNAGLVQPEDTGGLPTIQNDGSYHIMTTLGSVKVNDRLKTIQVGTTIYDLANADGSDTGVHLVYFDNEQQMLYFDIRCVMGLSGADFYRNEDSTLILQDAIGSKDYVVYDIGINGVDSTLFESYAVNCYNYPDNLSGNVNDTSVPDVNYTVQIMGSSYYDDKYDVTLYDQDDKKIDGARYWNSTGGYCEPSAVYNRMTLSSFVPSANWITVINQDGEDVEGDTTASLFVYYPIAPFEKGYADSVGVNPLNTVTPPSTDKMKEIDAEFEKAKTMPGLWEVLLSVYPNLSSNPEWYHKMTAAAAASLYEMTGLYYLDDSFVMREFKITKNNYATVYAWDEYTGITHTESANGIKAVTYRGGANADGAIYWLEGIGYVYNMPTTDEFTLSKYLSGQYPLPIAAVKNPTTASAIKVVNYNMNYWGEAVTHSSTGDFNYDYGVVPYGYTLTSAGFVHYRDESGNNPWNGLSMSGVNTCASTEHLALSSCTNAGETSVLPYLPESSTHLGDKMQLAPSGIYFYFGGNTRENAPVNTLTQTLTNVNIFLYGSNRVTFNSEDTSGSGSTKFDMVSTKYAPIQIPNSMPFYRVYHKKGLDVLIHNGDIVMGGTNAVQDVIIDDYVVPTPENPLEDKVGGTLLTAIDEGTSLAILFAFKVIPIIGIILMTILVSLAFLADARIFRALCEKFIDPVRILTFGARDINTWSWKKVLVPCLLMYIVFALVLNGNIIRVIQYLVEWWEVVTNMASNIF